MRRIEKLAEIEAANSGAAYAAINPEGGPPLPKSVFDEFDELENVEEQEGIAGSEKRLVNRNIVSRVYASVRKDEPSQKQSTLSARQRRLKNRKSGLEKKSIRPSDRRESLKAREEEKRAKDPFEEDEAGLEIDEFNEEERL